MTAKPFWGKYRGVVLSNEDPLFRGRILAQVPAVSSLLPTSWCEPCVPMAGLQMGAYMIPQIQAGVWIEFEQGDPSRPIWTGCFWGSMAELPAPALVGAPGSPSVVLQTTGQNAFVLSDMPGPAGGILLKTTLGASISLTDAGIVIQNGKGASITMVGPSIVLTNGTGATLTLAGPSVAINGAALVVT